ncbi:MAG: radical SAM protein [Candidatus Omnitrophica bacterium]|nr:radical SAM protein [Candidatus Omnitrophota bacterium]
MRILIVNLPWHRDGKRGVRAGSRWPFTAPIEKDGSIRYIPFPFFLAYTATLLKKEFSETRLIDAIAEGFSRKKAIADIQAFKPSLLLIETSTPSFDNDIKIIKEIKKILPSCRITLCGPHSGFFADSIINKYPFIDYIIIGEYEYTMLDLARQLDKGLSLDSVAGLVFRKRGLCVINKSRKVVTDLNLLPWPERESLSMYKYNDGFARMPVPNVQILSSRGCPFSCIFCLWPQTIYQNHQYRRRNPVDVVDEIDFLVKKYSFKAVYFDDDIFNADASHVLGICKEMKRRNIRVPWAAMGRADLMNKQLIEELASAGLFAIKYGVESADKRILEFARKNIDLEKTRQNIKATKECGIKVHLTFCLGLPGETIGTIKETAKFIKDTQPDSLQVSFATPFPGTKLYDYLQSQGKAFSKKWSDYDGNDISIIRNDKLNPEYLKRIKALLERD